MIDGPAGVLPVYSTTTIMGSAPRPPAVLCHELSPQSAGPGVGASFPALADRLADEAGFRVVVGLLRGVGEAGGDFSADGWLEDLAFLLDREVGSKDPVWLVGYGLGGALALRHSVTDRRVRGVAVLAAPSDLASWLTDAPTVVERCRAMGVIRSVGFPPDLPRWAQAMVALDPLDAVGRLGDRSLLVVHGTEDTAVPVAAGRELAGAARTTGTVDLRIVPGAGHGIRTDHRSVATLIGWLERQR
jgi:pimeloyl-ACP methyl ester carboxylesterase